MAGSRRLVILALAIAALTGCEAYYNPETGVAVVPAYYVSTGDWPSKERFGRLGVDKPANWPVSIGREGLREWPPPGYKVLAETRYNRTSPGGFGIETHNMGFGSRFEEGGILYKGEDPPMNRNHRDWNKPRNLQTVREGGRVFLRRK